MIHGHELVELAPPPHEASAELSTHLWHRSGSGPPGTDLATLTTREVAGADRIHEWRAAASRAAFLTRLESILRLGPDWDSYGAPPISVGALELALMFLSSVQERESAEIVPTSQGGIQIEWHRDGIDVELECFPSGRALFFAEDESTGESTERWVVPDHPAVEDWLRRVTRSR